MGGRQAPPDADPRRGRNPGYPEDQPGDRDDAQSEGKPPQPSPDVPRDPPGRPDDER
jgi:hypothetical protein